MQINNNLQQQIFQANLTINSNISNNINEEKYKKEINDLKSRLSRYENNIEVNLGDLVLINFESGDGQIRRGIQCMKNEIFAEVEEKLYKFYEELQIIHLLLMEIVLKDLKLLRKIILKMEIKSY